MTCAFKREVGGGEALGYNCIRRYFFIKRL